MPHRRPAARAALALVLAAAATAAHGHGDVAPQPVETGSLPDLGEEWLDENPYRSMGREVLEEAVRIGASGFNQNCARCHGLGAVSGGLAPDLRYLSADFDGDEWFVERFRHGYTQNGITKMPAFGELLGQKAAWAIRTYIETRPDNEALEPHAERLRQIRDELAAGVDDARAAQLRAELEAIAEQIPTLSGAEYADSPAREAALALAEGAAGAHKAAEQLTIGLSASH
ncbi:cytochrome c-550 PedF [Oceanicella actignis]|uniref:Cytochrome c-550 PedF n=1 Tax=Oceanicella actignis TaxID=1189325 RepID=A0A1M7RRH5_9RHOB|nr:cytochrome c-550 PedF [Oceanicella actignis]TYO89564.1 cytochrome c-550 PedF [Oceanicella actignis]SET08007.1 cytochrome c-550 PedF [Oceanicella actignis]SHN48706.1 cytochrome c-550 PedF [Oceanicella actignis]